MPIKSKYLFIASMDVDAGKEALFNEVYEIDGPHVLMSPEWAKAVEAGRWPGEVRPFTRNRKHAIYRVR
jgi:hypothetical protein